jgi:hypothetical protein
LMLVILFRMMIRSRTGRKARLATHLLAYGRQSNMNNLFNIYLELLHPNSGQPTMNNCFVKY